MGASAQTAEQATAAEGALEAELSALRAQWQAIQAAHGQGRAPAVLWRPDPLLRLLADNPGVSRVLVDDAATRNARLALAGAARQTLANGLGLLGVSAPEKM